MNSSTAPEGETSLSDRVLGGVTEELLGQLPEAAAITAFYHYTTSDGARGILDGQTIWATDVRFLNDSSEWHHTLQIAREVLHKADLERHASWGDLTHELEQLSGMTSYVACFSAEADQLSQWRAYSGQGYALGFGPGYLMGLSQRLPLTSIFAPVVYDLDRQRQAMINALSPLLLEDAEASDLDGIPHRALFVGAVSIAAAFFKHPDFEEEAEWRLVVRPPDSPVDASMPLHFRTVRGAVVPYRVVPIDRPPVEDTEGAASILLALHDPRLVDLIVGPGPDQVMAALGIRELLSERKFGGVEVRHSTIPFRG